MIAIKTDSDDEDPAGLRIISPVDETRHIGRGEYRCARFILP